MRRFLGLAGRPPLPLQGRRKRRTGGAAEEAYRYLRVRSLTMAPGAWLVPAYHSLRRAMQSESFSARNLVSSSTTKPTLS